MDIPDPVTTSAIAGGCLVACYSTVTISLANRRVRRSWAAVQSYAGGRPGAFILRMSIRDLYLQGVGLPAVALFLYLGLWFNYGAPMWTSDNYTGITGLLFPNDFYGAAFVILGLIVVFPFVVAVRGQLSNYWVVSDAGIEAHLGLNVQRIEWNDITGLMVGTSPKGTIVKRIRFGGNGHIVYVLIPNPLVNQERFFLLAMQMIPEAARNEGYQFLQKDVQYRRDKKYWKAENKKRGFLDWKLKRERKK